MSKRFTVSAIASARTAKRREVSRYSKHFGRKCVKRIVSILVLALLYISCAESERTQAAAPPADQILINGAGATFPYPIYSKWFSEYHRKFPQIQINYQSIGSGGGIRQVIEGTVDFGATDGPMTDEQLKQAKTKILHFPTVLGAVVPAY